MSTSVSRESTTWSSNETASPSAGAPGAGTRWSRTGPRGTIGSRLEFTCDPDAFAGKEEVADYLLAHAEKVGAPIRTGVEVTKVRKNEGSPGFHVETSDGTIDARFIVSATGAFQKPIIPRSSPSPRRSPRSIRATTTIRRNSPTAR